MIKHRESERFPDRPVHGRKQSTVFSLMNFYTIDLTILQWEDHLSFDFSFVTADMNVRFKHCLSIQFCNSRFFHGKTIHSARVTRCSYVSNDGFKERKRPSNSPDGTLYAVFGVFFFFSYFTRPRQQCLTTLSRVFFWIGSRRSTSLRTGHKAKTRGRPPVVEDDFTVTLELINQTQQRL